MSALAASLHRDGAPAGTSTVAQMLAAQRARGPDAQRTFAEGSVALGHGLLATTPEDTLAPQPFAAQGGAIVVALDGRIDNRDEIAGLLRAPLGTAADVEVVAAAYAAWGAELTARLIGDFALIVWDARRRELVLARDPTGARPLYHRETGATVLCASHPAALFAGAEERPRPDFEAMARFLAERYVEQPRTLVEGMRALPAGATLRIGARAPRLAAWSWPRLLRPLDLRPGEHEERLAETLVTAVRCRLRAAGPIAAHVSGGLDSSAVAALAARELRADGRGPPLLVRCTFPGLACDESEHSQAVADHLGLPIQSAVMPGELADYAPDPGLAPRLHPANPVSMMLVRAIAEARDRGGARVTLTGAGSDQLLQPTGFELADALLRGDARAAARWAGLSEAPLSRATCRRLLRAGVGRALPEQVRAAARRLLGVREALPSWMTPRAREAIGAARALDPTLARAVPRLPARRLVTQLAWDADYTYSVTVADGIAAAHGAELRHPFFDRRVIELLLSIPGDLRADSPPPKALLRRALNVFDTGGEPRGALSTGRSRDERARLLPSRVLDRAGAAEMSPLVKVALVDAHGDALAAMMARARLADLGLIDPAEAAATIERARRGDVWVLREVVTLTSLEIWLRQLGT